MEKLAVAIQMDPIELINFDSDSTLLLALETQRRGHALYYYQPKDLALLNGEVLANVHPLAVRKERGNHYTLGEPERIRLNQMDVVLIRQDPPFNMNYLTTTYHLERIHPKTLVVNNPAEIRNAPEKLLVCNFPELMAPTLITANIAEITNFRKEHKDIILKPLYAHGGRDVFHLKPGDDNLTGIIEVLDKLYGCPIIAQAYIPAVHSEGDKRIILVNGEPKGCLTRIPAEGQVRSNLVAGGSARMTELTRRDRDICAAIGPELKKRGLIFAGIDIIGDYITEINVTSPTGLPTANRFGNIQLERLIWDAIEEALDR